MSIPSQSLRIHRPSPTTISFTVSTRRLPETLPALALHYSLFALRVAFGVLILGVLAAKYHLDLKGEESPDPALLDGGETTSTTGVEFIWNVARPLLGKLEWRFLVPGCLAALWAIIRRGYKEESLLVLRGLGVQTSTSSATYLSSSITRFIPTTSIQDIFIHEAFKGFEVRFYMAIIVEGEKDVVVVFPDLLPKRQILEEVWRGTRECLWEPKRDGY